VDAVVWPAVQVSSVDTQTSCGRNNGAIDLTVNGGSGGFNYFWTGPGAIGNTQDQTALSGGTYDVVVTDDQSGCQFNYTTNIGSSPAVIITQDVTPINCFSASTGAITIGFVNNQGPVTFQWTGPNNQNLGSSLTLANLPTGLYVVNWNDNVCSGSDTIGVFQNGPILINGDVFVYDNGFNTSGFGVSDGQIITDVIGGSGGDYSYNWSQLNQTVEPSSVNNLAAGTYTLSVTDSLGCRVDTTFVLREPFDIHLPNGLTPNGDKFNDTYVILGLGDNSSGELKVYNRWGSLVYEKNNYQNQWAGTNTGGDPLSDGTYYVVFKLGNREFNTYVDLRR
jgi:gliding motility-associated-like protein